MHNYNKKELDDFLKDIEKLSSDIDTLAGDANSNTDIINHLTKYLIVLMSGYIDRYFLYTIEEYLHQNNELSQSTQYIMKNLEKLSNCKLETIKKVLSQFDDNWKDQIRTIDKNSNLCFSNSLAQIVDMRNKIAHCHRNINITKSDFLRHFDNSKELLTKIESFIYQTKE